jgi:hypothetical protein
MSDTSKMAMGPSVDRVQRLPTPLEESVQRTESVPASAIRKWRGGRLQREVARAAGISQGFLSELGCGQKGLTPGVARRLAPVLGTTVPQLVLGEHLARLNRAAQKGHIDLQPLLVEVEKLTEILPSGQVGEAIMDAIVRIVRDRQKLPN